jgi:hypothetical protein
VAPIPHLNNLLSFDDTKLHVIPDVEGEIECNH